MFGATAIINRQQVFGCSTTHSVNDQLSQYKCFSVESFTIVSTSFEQALKVEHPSRTLYIRIVSPTKWILQRKATIPQRCKLLSWRIWASVKWLPYIENNNSIYLTNMAWCRCECSGREREKKKKPTSNPSPLNYIKKVEQWVKGGSLILECSSEQCLRASLSLETQTNIELNFH